MQEKIFDVRVLTRDFQNELIIHLGEKTCTSLIASRLLFSRVTKLSLLVNPSIFFFFEILRKNSRNRIKFYETGDHFR